MGWRAGFLALAAAAAVATPLVLIPLWSRTRGTEPVTSTAGVPKLEGALRSAIRKPVFWMILVAFPAVGFAGTGLIVHLVPLLADDGMRIEVAARIAGIIGVFMIVARLIIGLLVDRFFAPRLAASIMIFCAAGYLVLALNGAAYGWLGALCIGLSIGAEFDLAAYIISRYFPVGAFGRVYGVVYGTIVACCALAPVFFGHIYDSTGAYDYALYVASGLFALAAVALLCMPKYPFLLDEPNERDFSRE
jgi:cyanate permease